MTRRCKCSCGVELLPAAKCTNIVEKKGYASIECLTRHTRIKEAAKKDKVIKDRNIAFKKTIGRNPKKLALESAQLLARISSADDDGICTCVTCGYVGKFNDGFDGGHFMAKGNCSYWMLDPRNIWPQCKPCNGNGMKYGNKATDYTIWMIDKLGREFVDHMKSMEKTVIKRSAQDYEEFISAANIEINNHKKRIGVKKRGA
jgi:hypothetical protein